MAATNQSRGGEATFLVMEYYGEDHSGQRVTKLKTLNTNMTAVERSRKNHAVVAP